jgi:predicted Zn finger-like uncharacterized protein
MIVTCPKCEARYAVDPLAIGPAGRTVQCARCDNRWFQRVEGLPPPPDLLIRPSPRSTSLPVPVETKAQSTWPGRLAVIALVIVLLGALGAGGYVYRDRLVGFRDTLTARFNLPNIPNPLKYFQSSSTPRPAVPPTRAAAPPPPAADTTPAASPSSPPSASPAAAASSAPSTATPPPAAPSTQSTAPRLDTPATPAQLEVDLSASKIELVDGRYVVHGEIANRGGSPGTATKLTVVFKKNNDVLSSKTYPLTLGPIAPGDRASFSQALDTPPPGATDIVPSVE